MKRSSVSLADGTVALAGALVEVLETRDHHSGLHAQAVGAHAADIAEQLGLDARRQVEARCCGLVHDIGTIGLPPGLLEKPGVLSVAERRLMETHPEIGERILARWEFAPEMALAVRHHHERWDGEGYPDGLSGEAIPLLSRIVAVADAYNAMTSDRPRCDAMPSRAARLRLAQASGSQFDPSVVAAFEAVLARKDGDHVPGPS